MWYVIKGNVPYMELAPPKKCSSMSMEFLINKQPQDIFGWGEGGLLMDEDDQEGSSIPSLHAKHLLRRALYFSFRT